MGVRMAPKLGRRSRSAAYRVAPTSWLRRIDLLILPIVFAVDILLFSRLLRTDGVDNATRVAIVCYSAVGVCLLIFRRLAPVLVFCVLWVHAIVALLLTCAEVLASGWYRLFLAVGVAGLVVSAVLMLNVGFGT